MGKRKGWRKHSRRRRHLPTGGPEGPTGHPTASRAVAVSAAITWRVLLLAAAALAVGYAAGKLLLVVVPVVVALLLATLLVPLAHRLRDRGMHERAASLLVVVAGIALIAVLLTLIVPPFVSELSELGTNVEKGSRKAGQVLQPLGVSQAEVDKAIDDGVESLKGSGGKKLAGGAVTGALAALNLLAAVLLTLVLTFFFVKDGRRMWGWIVGPSACCAAPARRVGQRVWRVLTGYVHGVALVAVIDAVLIRVTLVVVGVPLAMPLTVLTFVAAFFPVVGAVAVGAAAVLVALVAKGARGGDHRRRGDPARPAARRQRAPARAGRQAARAAPRRGAARPDRGRRHRRPRRGVHRRAPRRGGGGRDRLRALALSARRPRRSPPRRPSRGAGRRRAPRS